MTRVLPGVYGSIFDNSQLPEGQGSLTVGYVLACNKGTIGEPFLVTSPSDFLEKTTLSGKPPVNGDPTFTSIIKTLGQTNQIYVSRVYDATNPPLYGGLVVKREYLAGEVSDIEDASTSITVGDEVIENKATEITLVGLDQANLKIGDLVRLYGTDDYDGRYTVADVTTRDGNTVVTINVALLENLGTDKLIGITGTLVELYKTAQPQPINKELIGEIKRINNEETIEKKPATFVYLYGNCADYALQGDLVQITGLTTDNGLYVIYDAEYDIDTNETVLKIQTKFENNTQEGIGSLGQVYRNSLANPESYVFQEDDLYLIYGKDPGAYNGDLAINIVSTTESPDQLGDADTMQIQVYNALSGVELGNPFICSRSETAYSTAGEPLYIEQVINGNSEYINVLNNTLVDEDILPCDTVQPITDNTTGEITGYRLGNAECGGGYDGTPIVPANSAPFITALEGFKDKTIPVSILGNGWCEVADYQQALIDLAEGRLDCFTFISSRKVDEQAQSNTTKANNIVNYKKKTLGSTSYMSAMYAPHVTTIDTINSKKVQIGADAIAIAGWLNVINTQGYPYAFAGYDDGAVTGVTTQWKIGDQSGQAQVLNDASINYVAYDAKDGIYYMQCQNTLQIANSALRNIGTVLNILDIKETFMRYFKPFIQKPITDDLRGLILNGGQQQVNLYIAQGRITNGVLQDVSTDYDISNNTLRYILTIAPTPYAQVIYLRMNIVNQTYDFSILQSV